jgi:hypothetical protein
VSDDPTIVMSDDPTIVMRPSDIAFARSVPVDEPLGDPYVLAAGNSRGHAPYRKTAAPAVPDTLRSSANDVAELWRCAS